MRRGDAEPSRGGRLVAGVAILAALFVAAYQSAESERGSLRLGRGAIGSRGFNPNQAIDRLVQEALHNGNVALVARDTEKYPWNENALAALYFRGCYAALPHRIFAAPPDAVINEAKDFTSLNWRPDEQFVRENQISTILIVSADQHGVPAAYTMSSEEYLRMLHEGGRLP